jgi:hypothetical protein
METKRTIKAVKVASATHSINPVDPVSDDASALNEHPLWDMANFIGFVAVPTEPLDPKRIAKNISFLESKVVGLKSPHHQRDVMNGRIVGLTALADRMLMLAAANQADPKLLQEYLKAYERVRDLAEREKASVQYVEKECIQLDYRKERLEELNRNR